MSTRIRLSSWAQRLWTLREAILATNMHVEFEDETVHIKELEIESQETMREMTLTTSIITHERLNILLARTFESFDNIRNIVYNDRGKRFSFVR
jgi:hypothetical protein